MESQTSFPEQAIFYYLNTVFDANNRYVFHGYEIDIFIPELNTGIEYGGEYYHASKASKEREIKKDAYLKKHGIRVIRVKESNYNETKGDYVFCKPNSNYAYLKEVVDRIGALLGLKNEIDVDIAKDKSQILSQYIKKKKEKSLLVVYPEIAAEWDYERNGKITPDMISSGSKMEVWWKCKNGHSWQVAVYSRKHNGCKYCSGKTLIPGINDLKSQNPELALEWDYEKNGDLKPEDITVNNGEKVWWKCQKCRFSWPATPAHRNSDRGCPKCAKKTRSDTFCKTRIKLIGSLADIYPDIASEWDYEKNKEYTPQTVSPHSGKIMWWKCRSCGFVWPAYISNRVKGVGCPECAKATRIESRRLSRIKEIGSLADSFPDLVSEWNSELNGELTPYSITSGSSERVWWKCKNCGYVWPAIVSNRTRKGQGCPECRKKKKKNKN